MGELSNTTINGVSYDFKDAGAARQLHSHTKSQITDFPTSMPASDVPAWAKASSKPSYTASEVGAIATTAKGAASGVAELDANGKVPSSQLPSFVDDVLEYSAKSSFPATGETGKIYVDTTTNKTYRWSGSAYVEISESLALGETSSTAYRGDRGKAAYDHSQTTSGNPHNVTKSDVGLENVGNFKAVSTVASQGLSNTEKANARANIGAGTSSFSGSYNDLSNKPTSLPASDVYSWAKASSKPSYTASEVGAVPNTTLSGSPDLDTYLTTGVYHITTSTATHAPTTNHATLFVDATVGTPYQIFKPDTGDTVWYTRHRSGSAWTVWVAMKFTDTTYSAATTSAAGLMSAADKTKLNGIATGAQVNETITEISLSNFISLASGITYDTVEGYPNTSYIYKQGKHIFGYLHLWSQTAPSGSVIGTIKSDYRPAKNILTFAFEGNSNVCIPIPISTDGTISRRFSFQYNSIICIDYVTS